MALTFDKGSAQEPKGHAIVYFHSGEKVLALYVVVLPIVMNITKYIPPLLAPQFSSMGPQEMSAVALPPVPEEVENHEHLAHLADARNDDLAFGGNLSATVEATGLIEAANGVVQEYAQLCKDYTARMPAAVQEADGGVGVNEVLYSLMGERDKLAEMSKLISKLRFAVEGGDTGTTKEAKEEIHILGKYLPEMYLIPRLLKAALTPKPVGGQLAQLYLERCYRLSNNDPEGARKLEERIRSLEVSG
jgi:hypothetical protein